MVFKAPTTPMQMSYGRQEEYKGLRTRTKPVKQAGLQKQMDPFRLS